MINNPIDEEEDTPFMKGEPYTKPLENNLKKEFKPSLWSAVLVVFSFAIISVAISFFLTKYISPNNLSTASIILRPELDRRQYKAMVLPNELKVLLISDPDAEIAGVSLDVGVGSYAEPKNIPGIAHFLEHMLFRGSKKYPKDDEFSTFLTINGGDFNAYTSDEDTNFYFTLSSKALEQALEIFSRFFIDPSLRKDSVLKEINAIESEYQNALTKDEFAFGALLKTLASKSHPFARFSMGSFAALTENNKDELHSSLKKFHDDYYSANLMSLVILGKQSIETLEEWTKNKFTLIPNNKTIKPTFGKLEMPFEKNLPLATKMFSKTKKSRLSVVFPLPETQSELLEKTLEYISSLLGFEGTNSLTSHLKSKSYATNLEVGVYDRTSDQSLFMIAVTLTDKGVKEPLEVLKAIFACIKLIKKEGVKLDKFQEMAHIAKLNFRFKEKKDSLSDEVKDLARNLQLFPTHYVLAGSSLFVKFNENSINQFLNLMTPKNSIIILSTNEVNGDQSTKGKTVTDDEFFKNMFYENYSDLYKLNYTSKPLSKDWTKILSSVQPSEYPTISLPLNNEYIPWKPTLIPSCSDSANKTLECTTEASNDLLEDYPQRLSSGNKSSIWFKVDRSFGVPKIESMISFESPIPSLSPKDYMLTSLLASFIEEEISEELYAAKNVGYEFNVKSSLHGIEISYSGWSKGMNKVTEKLLSIVRKPNIIDSRFYISVEKVRQGLEEVMKTDAFRQGTLMLQELLYEKFFTPSELLGFLEKINMHEVESFAKAFFEDGFVRGLFVGNVFPRASNYTNAIQLAELINSAFNDTKSPAKKDLFKEKSMSLVNQSLVYRTLNTNTDDTNYLALNFYEYSTFSKNSSLLYLFSDGISNEAFNYMRGELKLGYIATSGVYSIAGNDGIIVLVQGPVAKPEELDLHIEETLDRFYNVLVNLTNSDFEALRDGALTFLQQKDRSLKSRIDRYWKQILSGELDFMRREEMKRSLEELNKETLVDFYQDFLKRKSSRISIQIFPSNSKIGVPDLLKGNKTFGNQTEVLLQQKSDFKKFKFSINIDDKIIEECLKEPEVPAVVVNKKDK